MAKGLTELILLNWVLLALCIYFLVLVESSCDSKSAQTASLIRRTFPRDSRPNVIDSKLVVMRKPLDTQVGPRGITRDLKFDHG